MEKRDKLVIVVFSVFTLAAGFIGRAVDMVLTEQPEGQSLGMLIWLILPLLISVIIRLTNKGYFEPVGFKMNFGRNAKIYAISLLIFPLISIVCTRTAYQFNQTIVGGFDRSLVGVVVAGAVLKNLVEEITWRGNMVPFFEKTEWNDYLIYLSTGLIWGCWHIPYYLYFVGLDGDMKLKTILSGIVIMLMWTPLFVEVRRATRSFIPAYLLHMTEELSYSLIFVPAGKFKLNKTYDIFMNPVSGIIPLAFILVLGLILRNRRVCRGEVLCQE